jgi:glycosyltransferase involved in cell wall biosynthesis
VNQAKPAIIYVANADPFGGSPHPFMAAIWLTKAGYDVEAILPVPASTGEIAFPTATLPVTGLPTGRGWFGRLFRQARLMGLLFRRRFQHPDALFYIHGSSATAAAWLALLGRSRRKVVYHSQDFLEPYHRPIWEFFERRFARRAGHVFVNEPNRGRFMASHYGLAVSPTIVRTALPGDWPHPAFDEAKRAELITRCGGNSPQPIRLITTLGPIDPIRGGRPLLQALAGLPPNYRIVTAAVDERTPHGGATLAYMQETGLITRTVFLEKKSFSELLQTAAACDVGILIYPDDGIGNFYQAPGRLTEYLACGLPFVMSNFPGFELLALKHQIGLCCDPTDPEAIRTAIIELAERRPEIQHAERQRFQCLARNELAYECQADRILQAVARAGAHS